MLRKKIHLAASTAALLLAALAPASAEPSDKKSDQPAKKAEANDAASCQGRDMLPELAALDPLTYERILSVAAKTENANAVLWKIEKPGVEPSHLFATVHLTDPRVTTLSEKVRDALEHSKTVALEAADLSPTATASALAVATKSTLFAEGQSLDALLSPDEFAQVKSTVDRAGLPADTARLFRPWIVTMLIAASDCERKKIQGGEPVLDMKLGDEAKSRGIEVVGLETIEEQLQAMASLPDQQQLGMLRAGLRYADRNNDLVETMVRFYLDRRIGATWPFQLALAAKTGISPDSFAGFEDTLIIERNKRLRDRALPYIDRGGAFIAVGALHLTGKSGLVALLRQSGYTVTAIE